ncbi:MAG: response regulator [Deltaproteobacteria bacterium]|nr:MAG: response regulator [Deltaproteobacteria bacterium]
MNVARIVAIAPADDAAAARLAELLAPADIAVVRQPDAGEACAALVMDGDEATCVAVVATDLDAIRHVRDTLPDMPPVAVGRSPAAADVVAAFRAGAFDLIDVAADSQAAVLATFDRVLAEAHRRADRRRRLAAMRAIVEDFLRVLVKAERRSLDLEQRIAGGPEPDIDPDRPPRVLVVDDDPDVVDMLVHVLATEGIDARSAGAGAPAIEQVAQARTAGEAVDLLLIDKNLPDIDGLRVIGRCRDIDPHLTAMIMTGFASTESAIDAADLGVAGYVLKPFDDIASLVRRVREVADRALAERRERRYLARIKERHSEFLLRYRQLAAQFDKLA